VSVGCGFYINLSTKKFFVEKISVLVKAFAFFRRFCEEPFFNPITLYIYRAARVMIYCTLHRVNRVLGLYSEFGLPHPLIRRRMCPLPGSGGTHSLAEEGVGVPITTMGQHSRYICTLWWFGTLGAGQKRIHKCHCNCKVVTS
jgi:hypothetical protein